MVNFVHKLVLSRQGTNHPTNFTTFIQLARFVDVIKFHPHTWPLCIFMVKFIHEPMFFHLIYDIVAIVFSFILIVIFFGWTTFNPFLFPFWPVPYLCSFSYLPCWPTFRFLHPFPYPRVGPWYHPPFQFSRRPTNNVRREGSELQQNFGECIPWVFCPCKINKGCVTQWPCHLHLKVS